MRINELCAEAYRDAEEKGWHEGGVNVPEKLCLIHSEVSEGLECYRNGEDSYYETVEGKPCGLSTELADVVIRIADLTEYLGIDLEAAIIKKMAYNKTRAHRHGGKVC